MVPLLAFPQMGENGEDTTNGRLARHEPEPGEDVRDVRLHGPRGEEQSFGERPDVHATFLAPGVDVR